MKKLNFNLSLLSLLFFIAISFSFKEAAAVSSDDLLVLPYGYDNDEAFAIKYLEESDDLQREKMAENYRIQEFLLKESKWEEVARTLCYGDNFADVDLAEFLNSEQLNTLKSFVAHPHYNCSCYTSSGNCWTKRTCCNCYWPYDWKVVWRINAC